MRCWRLPDAAAQVHRLLLMMAGALTADGGSGTSGVHAWSAPVMRGPGADFRVIARTVQEGWPASGPGRLAAWPLVSDRSARRGSGVKRDVARTFTRYLSPVLVARRSQSRLMLEGRARTLSGPSPDLSQATPLSHFRPAAEAYVPDLAGDVCRRLGSVRTALDVIPDACIRGEEYPEICR